MRKILLATTAVLLTAGVVAVAVAGPRGGCSGPMGGAGIHRGAGGPMLFETFDRDGDGRVTAAEIEAVRADRFARFDRDGDGALALAEFQPLWAETARPRMVDRFQALDADGDGAVTAAEFDRPMARMLRRGDADGDGAIDAEDMRRRCDDGRRGGWRD